MNSVATSVPATSEPTEGVKIEVADRWKDAVFLPCVLSVEIQVPAFTVRKLFGLERDSILDTGWAQGTDVPVKINAQLIGWAEFEVLSDRLAVRMTELY
jgi:flagellar motor switch/type III secretory pathway protein FliN